MNKRLPIAISSLAVVAALSSAGAARAADVAWSVGIGLPGVGAVISNGPSYRHGRHAGHDAGDGGGDYAAAPVYVPAPAYVPGPTYVSGPIYAPLPVYVQPRAAYRSARVVYGAVPVVDFHGPVYRHRVRPVPIHVWAPPPRHRHHGH